MYQVSGLYSSGPSRTGTNAYFNWMNDPAAAHLRQRTMIGLRF